MFGLFSLLSFLMSWYESSGVHVVCPVSNHIMIGCANNAALPLAFLNKLSSTGKIGWLAGVIPGLFEVAKFQA